MDHVTVNLTNCYGIKKLQYTFDFTEHNTYAVYAPNGSMKSSFAQVFQDLAEDKKSQDRLFPSRPTIRSITDENSQSLASNNILVLPPYDEFFNSEQSTSTLLINRQLRQEYERLNIELDQCKASFLQAMKSQSKSRKKNLDDEIASSFTSGIGDSFFYQALERIDHELKQQQDAPFQDIEYDILFDEKVLDALSSRDVQSSIGAYISKYNTLLDSSTYFKRGVFEYYNATQIAKTLASNGFFKARHTISLNAPARREINSQQQLEEVVAAEYDSITNDPELKTQFDAIKRRFERNIQLRNFHRYLGEQQRLLPHLTNIPLLKENIWKSYFKANEDLFYDLLNKYRRIKKRRTAIEAEASYERTRWEDAIDLFNERFFVPFRLEVKNKAAVILGDESVPTLGYRFQDSQEEVPVERDDLLKSLSQGEKKALYILNVIFEIEARRHTQQRTLFVIDDIADSFDYKNKYAIIQYLQDVADDREFKQIILTHNFDFFRTVNSRFVGYPASLTADKSSEGITIKQADAIRNPFVNSWKPRFFDDSKKRIASIAFLRNIIEYTRGDTNADYVKLTSLLHWKTDSASIKQSDLDNIFRRVFDLRGEFAAGDDIVTEDIFRQATNCLNDDGGARLEHKIVLAIATRLAAERFMLDEINDPTLLGSISSNQTAKLLERFEREFGSVGDAVKVLRKVMLMTPENIHLNAFMYEPLVDMSDDSLKSLFTEVRALASRTI